MPSVLTHYGFNKELFDNKIEFLNNNEDVYLVGAQGPDPFLFYGIVPFLFSKDGKEVRFFGSKLHKIDPSNIFESMLEYSSNKKEKDILYSYILGAGMHYILDRKIHPYVFYKTGFSEEKHMKKKYFVDHTLFETNLDVLLMLDKYKDYKVKPSSCIVCDEVKIKEVSKLYEYISKSVLDNNIIGEKTFEDAYKHMCKIENLLYSKKGVKKKIVNGLFKNTPFNTMMHPLDVDDKEKIDYLNLKKEQWQDPSSEVVFNKDIYELIEEAKVEAREWIKLVVDSYNGEKVSFSSFTKGYVYDGCLQGSKMKVFKSVYKKEEGNK